MALVIPEGFASAAFVFTGAAGTQPFVTTLGLNIGSETTSFVDVANAVKAAYVSSLGPVTWNGLVLDRVTLSVGSSGPGGSVDSDTAPDAMGASMSAPMTLALAAIARKSTDRLGRSGRGRMFLPGVLNEVDVDPDGSITTARRATLNAALDDFLDDLTTALVEPVLLHSTGVTVFTPTPITGLTTSDLVGIIRGRIR